MRVARRIATALVGVSLMVAPAFAGEPGQISGTSGWLMVPFAVLLLAIAIVPLLNKGWWDRKYPHVAAGLGIVAIALYLFMVGDRDLVIHTAHEYVSFIVLIGSLFVISGGIQIRIRGKSKPLANVFLLAIGGVAANLVGTTGASILLIRPYLEVNRYRIKPYHIAFFIFVVSNIGGGLTPVGPPLFLGFINGIPFFWVAEHVWVIWLAGLVSVLAVFYAVDLVHFRRLSPSIRREAGEATEEGEANGIHNVGFLMVVLIAVFISNPPLVREAIMLVTAYVAYRTTSPAIRRRNDFTFAPMTEVAILFAGIFATMIPALDWLAQHSSGPGALTPPQIFWASGSLSSVLDNAPTYLCFLTGAIGSMVDKGIVAQVGQLIQTQGHDLSALSGMYGTEVHRTVAVIGEYHADAMAGGQIPLHDIQIAYLLGNHRLYIEALSVASVFFGAFTYIGNGPNMMVRSIAEHAGVRCPGFFEYIWRYAIPVLLPIFALLSLLFFVNGG